MERQTALRRRVIQRHCKHLRPEKESTRWTFRLKVWSITTAPELGGVFIWLWQSPLSLPLCAVAATCQQSRWRWKGEEWQQPHPPEQGLVSVCSLQVGQVPSLGPVCSCTALAFPSWLEHSPTEFLHTTALCDNLANTNRENRSHRLWPCKRG